MVDAAPSLASKVPRIIALALLLGLHLWAASRPLAHQATGVREWRKGPLVYETSPYGSHHAARLFWPVAVGALDLYLLGILAWRRAARRRGRNRSGLVDALVSLVALGLALAAAEGTTRLLVDRWFPGQYRPDPDLFWYNRPNLRDFVGPRDPVPKSTNSLGMRGTEEHPIERTGDELRIFVVGDSSTFGLGVRDHQTFSHVLQIELNRALRRKVTVINSGCPGHTSHQGQVLLSRHGLPRRPDLLIWAYNNDSCLDTAREVDRVSHDATALAVQRLLYRSDLYLVLRRVVLDAVYGVRLDHYLKKYPSEKEGWVRRIDFDEYKKYLNEFNSLSVDSLDRSARRKLPVLFVRMPLNRPMCQTRPIFLTSFDDRYRDHINRWTGRHGLPFVDFEQRFLSPYREELFLKHHLFHPSAEGHRIIGEGLARLILERKLLPR